MTAIKIEFWDNWKVAREKINAIIDEVNASIPSIWENGNWYIWGVDTWIRAVWLILKPWDNLLKQNSNDETYVDLQFRDWLTPTSAFNLWVTVGNVDSTDWWIQSWILLHQETSEWYCRLLYGNDWNLYFDWGLWVFKRIATTEYVDNALTSLRNDLHTVAFTGKSSDLDNDYWFSAVPILTQHDYDNIPTAWGDDKEYMIYKKVNR